MKLVPFIAENANAALAQIQEKLGPDAIVVSVRRLPAPGLSRLWHRNGHIEVLACAPDDKPVRKIHSTPPGEDTYSPFSDTVDMETPAPRVARQWRSISWLESLGLLPEYGDRLEQRVRELHGDDAPLMPITEWTYVRKALAEFWHEPPQHEKGSSQPHVFVGPPGSGKTTVLCKWMTTAVLSEDQSVRVWRLDGVNANTSEFLTLHSEMMGVPIERFWNPPDQAADLLFVDLPGVEMHDSHGLAALREQLATLPQPHVHLVLNAACDISILFEQFKAFAVFSPKDLIFTHLDEEQHRVKLWNFVLGTKCSISFLSAGQKIPGEFQRAESALLFPCGKRH